MIIDLSIYTQRNTFTILLESYDCASIFTIINPAQIDALVSSALILFHLICLDHDFRMRIIGCDFGKDESVRQGPVSSSNVKLLHQSPCQNSLNSIDLEAERLTILVIWVAGVPVPDSCTKNGTSSLVFPNIRISGTCSV